MSHSTGQTQYQGFGGSFQHTMSVQDSGPRGTAHRLSPGSSHSSPQSPQSQAELSVEEDKRRRNTEASGKSCSSTSKMDSLISEQSYLFSPLSDEEEREITEHGTDHVRPTTKGAGLGERGR